MYGTNNYLNPFAAVGYPQPTPMQMPQMPTANMLPAQKIIEVHGKESVSALRMAPNSSALLMDNTAPIVWMAISDGVGQVTATPFDIVEHKEAPPVDMSLIEKRLEAVEAHISHLMEGVHDGGKSDDGGTKASEDGAGVILV